MSTSGTKRRKTLAEASAEFAAAKHEFWLVMSMVMSRPLVRLLDWIVAHTGPPA